MLENFLYILIVICQFSSYESEYVFKDACNLHEKESTLGYSTPTQLLTSIANAEWLFETKDEIQKWYDIGYKECQDYYSKNKFGNDLPGVFEFGGQQKCRGTNMLYKVSGMLVWPFGPYKSDCPTYSKCWYGILTCGEVNTQKINDLVKDNFGKIKKILPDEPFPKFIKWSIKSVYVHMRVAGAEIVVPEQKYLALNSVANGGFDDVIIAQYTLTIPDSHFLIQLRQAEFYPLALYEFSEHAMKSSIGLVDVFSVYLGGSEDRCRPWTRCTTPNYCCGCDDKSFVVGTPLTVNAVDGLSRCPKARSKELPLCSTKRSNEPGRWIMSKATNAKPGCNVKDEKEGGEKQYNMLVPSAIVPDHNPNGDHPEHKWYEISGDPCVIFNIDPEDLDQRYWFFAPYRCKYHVYARKTLHKCLKETNITHIHFQGDSMARDLFSTTSSYLGVQAIQEGELKKLTNEMKQKQLLFHSGELLISEGYSWDWDMEVMRQTKMPPLPQVVVTNHALSHRQSENLFEFMKRYNETEFTYWSQEYQESHPLPKHRFFQGAKDLHGRKGGEWSADRIRRAGNLVKESFVNELGFIDLDEYVLTAGRIDNYGDRNDGWHYWGTMRMMEVVVLFNMLCNDWYIQQQPYSLHHSTTTVTRQRYTRQLMDSKNNNTSSSSKTSTTAAEMTSFSTRHSKRRRLHE